MDAHIFHVFVRYKVLYAARHGQAYHNVAEEKYGTPAWNSHWSRETTDGEIVVRTSFRFLFVVES